MAPRNARPVAISPTRQHVPRIDGRKERKRFAGAVLMDDVMFINKLGVAFVNT
jgi:hypothetical protein